ncbi:ABC transporter ATP-binding protein [Ferrimonas lipolytica]|uniref:ABC transporter ATP-binding protein n=1 Tax=Ferrimonas lipolytica TaxID=2724191 RepID=A0A6H1UCI2_9GAMM|nr:ABC transporter ATP-binding protein [Ferrimonas lipolytica]QIZ76290.1 ABC transporter ATP-binding protein [Ferrimonas lipolytica]
MTALLQARGLKKNYGDIEAVKGINLTIKQGCCFGLLGPNGAGKSSTLEMLEGLTKPHAGQILFAGKPIDKHYTQRIGIQFQQTTLPDYLTVFDCLKLFASFYRHSADLEQLVELCQLGEIREQMHFHLSGGQKQRLLLALSLINEPDLLFLDEPTTGLDPQARQNFWELIHSIKRQGKTIVLTTHYMDEAEQLCDTIAIMDHGKIIAEDTPAKLLANEFYQNIVCIDGELPQGEAQQLKHQYRGGQTLIECDQLEPVLSQLSRHGISLQGLTIRKPNLDDLFLKLTGHQLRA